MQTYSLLIILVLITFISYGQNQRVLKIRTLEKDSIRLEYEIKNRIDSLTTIKKEIKYQKNKIYLSKFKKRETGSKIYAFLRMNGKLRESSNPLSKIITLLKKKDTVRLINFTSGYWLIQSGNYHGYLSDLYIEPTKEVKLFKSTLLREQEKKKVENEKVVAKRREKEVALKRERLKDYRQGILKKYGKELGKKLLKGDIYWIGMTKEMAIISLGKPDDINKSVGSWGVHEQWVYDDKTFLYFDNGKLTSFQN